MGLYYVYLMTNKKYGVLYVGVTNNLTRMAWEHKHYTKGGFTAKYKLNKLVYFETTGDIESAIRREKTLKNWKRSWKLDLVNNANPEWRDLYYDLI